MTKATRSFIDHLGILLVVSLLTILIWMLAEAESLRVERLRAEVTFRTDRDAPRLVRVEAGQDFAGFVHLRVEGPTTRVDDLANTLRNRLLLEPGMDGIPLEPGRHSINLLDVLRSHPAIRDRRVNIAEVEPATVIILIDNLVTRELPVRVALPEGQLPDGAPEVTPPVISVRMPEAALQLLPEGAQLVARPDPQIIAALAEGRRGTFANVGLELPAPIRGMEGIRMSPSQVTVSLTLRSRTAAHVLPTVPIHLRLPPAEAALWDIQIPPESRLLTDVSVTGPADIIDQVRDGRLRPIAYITLAFEELERAAASGQPIQAEVAFSDMPSPVRFEYRPRTIPVTVRPRNSATSPGEGGT